MTKRIAFTLMLTVLALQAQAQERTWRNDVKPLVDAKCVQCHGATAPEYNDWQLMGEAKEKTAAAGYPHPHDEPGRQRGLSSYSSPLAYIYARKRSIELEERGPAQMLLPRFIHISVFCITEVMLSATPLVISSRWPH